jgi:hypothetical protein
VVPGTVGYDTWLSVVARLENFGAGGVGIPL